MCQISEVEHLLPYNDMLLGFLRGALTNSIPGVRQAAAVGISCLCKGVGGSTFETLMQEMRTQLMTEGHTLSQMDGLARCIALLYKVQPDSVFAADFDELLESIDEGKSHVRTGFGTVLIYLPAGTYVCLCVCVGWFINLIYILHCPRFTHTHTHTALQERFAEYLPRTFPTILETLSDEIRQVREVVLRAGAALLQQYGGTHTSLLLPALERSMDNEDWRIRMSAGMCVRVCGCGCYCDSICYHDPPTILHTTHHIYYTLPTTQCNCWGHCF
jgi:hypothetical protein